MQSVSLSSMQLLWNGNLTNTFSPTKGVRQDDPLSSYLFVLSMEQLGHLIDQSIETGVGTIHAITDTQKTQVFFFQ